MKVGYHHLDDSCPDVLPASTFLDVAGVEVGMKSPERLARPYFKGRPDPKGFARDVATWHGRGCRVQLGNEPNLPMEGFGGTVPDYADWFLAVANHSPTNARLYYAGISPGLPDWRDWYTHPLAKQAIARAHGLCVHAYGSLEQIKDVVWWVYSQFPGKPLWLGEFNFGAGLAADRDAWARGTLRPLLDWLATVPTMEAATYFAWTWPTPDMGLPTPVDARGTEIERVLREWTPPQKEQPVIRGIDISNNNGHVDLRRVKDAGYEFVILKISEDDWGDDDFFDRFAAENLANARALGMGVGVYTFLRPSKSSPAESITLIERALARLGGLQAGESVWLDVEDEHFTGDLHVWLAEALALGSQVFGFPLGKYSADWYTSTRNLEHEDLAPYPTWWASYQAALPAPQAGWGPIRVWQHDVTQAGAVPGVAGRCDVNVFYGTLDDFKALGKPAEVPQVDPVRLALADVKAAVARLEAALDAA